MKQYYLIDHSCIEETPEKILEYEVVSTKTISRIRKAIPHDQREYVEEGDELSVYSIKKSNGNDNSRLTIWLNKEIAAFETSNGSIWGDWDEDEELLLTGDNETAQDVEGATIIGRRAYNIYGISGIYALGRFYTLLDEGLESP